MAKSAAVRSTGKLVGARIGAKDSRRALFGRRDRFIVTFDSGKGYSFPRSSLEVDDGRAS